MKKAVAYASPDSGPNCFIGFKGVSKKLSAMASDSLTYAHFVYYFYKYALQYDYSVNDALDEASFDLFGCSFGDSELYKGYDDWYEMPGMPAGLYPGQMVVYGNGNNYLP